LSVNSSLSFHLLHEFTIMRFSVVLVVLSTAFASVSAAVSSRQLPNCALSCLASGPLGNCASNDNACLCRNTAFITETTQCIEQSCSGSDLTEAEQYSQQLCEAVGVTLTSTPTASSSTGSSGTSSQSSTKSSTGTSTGTSTSSTSNPLTTHSGAMANGANVLLGLTAAGLVALVL